MSLNHITLSLSITPPCTLDKNPQYRISGVVLALPMDELCPNDPVKDYSGNGNHGTATDTTIENHPLFTGKKIRYFNGLTSYITIANSDSLKITGNEIAIFARVSVPQGYMQTMYVLAKGVIDSYGTINYGIRFWQNRPSTYFRLNGENVGFDFGFGYGEFPFETLTSLGSTLKEGVLKNFTDGVVTAEHTVEYPIETNNNSVCIGRHSTGHSQFWKGYLCDIFVFNKSVSDANMALMGVNYCTPKIEAGKVYVRGRVADGNGLNKCIDKLKRD